MSDNELRVKVAELCGWERGPKTNITCGWMSIAAMSCWHKKSDEGDWQDEPPNFPKDLNACHEMEETMTDIQFCKYVQTICGHTTKGVKIEWTGPDAGRACHATARSRCEAFVKVMEGGQ